MTVSITRADVKLLTTRAASPLSDAEIDSILADASSQVAEWVTESTASGLAGVTFSQHYQNKLAKLEIQLAILQDRMTAAADKSEEYSEVSPSGSQQATSRRFVIPTNLDKIYAALKKERDTLLNKLGVSTGEVTLSARSGSAIRGEEETDLDMTWTDRASSENSFIPKVLRNR